MKQDAGESDCVIHATVLMIKNGYRDDANGPLSPLQKIELLHKKAINTGPYTPDRPIRGNLPMFLDS